MFLVVGGADIAGLVVWSCLGSDPARNLVGSGLAMLVVSIVALHASPGGRRERPREPGPDVAAHRHHEDEEDERVVGQATRAVLWAGVGLTFLMGVGLLPAPPGGGFSGWASTGHGTHWAGLPLAIALGASAAALPLGLLAFVLVLIGLTRDARAQRGYRPWRVLPIVGLAIAAVVASCGQPARPPRSAAMVERVDTAWGGLAGCWGCCKALSGYAAGAGGGAVVIGVMHLADASASGPSTRVPEGPLAALLLIVAVVLVAMAWTLRSAATEGPVSPVARETWFSSPERVLATAEIHGDARNVLIAYAGAVAAASAWMLITAMSVLASAAWAVLGYGRSVPRGIDTIREAVLASVQPYATGALSLLTVGTIAALFSAQKKLTVLRADIAHRQRVWEHT